MFRRGFEKNVLWRSLRRGFQHLEMKNNFQTVYLCFLALVILILIIYSSNDEESDSEERNGRYLRPTKFWSPSSHWISNLQKRSDRRNNDSIVIIYWTKVFDNYVSVGNNMKWPFFHIGTHCPVSCTLTTDHSRKQEATAIVVHARNIDEMPSQDKELNGNTLWILHSNESPTFTPALNSPQIMSKFNYYISYRLDSDFPLSLFLKPSLEPSPVSFHKKHQVPAVALYSHCEAVRTRYLVKLMSYIVIDSYGGCLHNTELPENILPRNAPNSAKSSVELYKNYKFTIVFMNSDCDYFVDEKLYHALSAGSVPVFMGTDKIDEFLPGNLRNAIIKVRDFATPELLASYLKYLAKDEIAYNRYLRWKYEGYNFPTNYSKSVMGHLWDGLPLFCRLCAALHSGIKARDGLPAERCARRNLRNWIKS